MIAVSQGMAEHDFQAPFNTVAQSDRQNLQIELVHTGSDLRFSNALEKPKDHFIHTPADLQTPHAVIQQLSHLIHQGLTLIEAASKSVVSARWLDKYAKMLMLRFHNC